MTNDRQGLLARTIVSLVLVLVVLGLGVLAFKKLASMRKPPEVGAEGAPLVRVRTESLVRRDHQETVSGYGRARALREVQVSAEVQGLVAEISPRLEPGAAIAEGELIARIDDQDYRGALERLRAQLAQLEADLSWKRRQVESIETQLEVIRRELALFQAELARTEALQSRGTASDSDLDSQRRATATAERVAVKFESDLALARIDVEKSLAGLDALRSELRQAERDLKRCEIRAPFAGVVVERSVTLGARVGPGSALCRIIDPKRIEVAIALPASFKSAVRPGSTARLEQADGSLRLDAKVTRVAPSIDAAERTFMAYVELDAEQGDLPAPGAFLRARVDGPLQKDVYVIPRTAFLGDQVFVVVRRAPGASEARVEARSFSRDRILPNVILSRDPAAEGIEVVRDNLEQIASGTRVSIVGESESAK